MKEPTHPINGSKTKAIRDAKGWTQEELAEKAGVSKRTVEHAESGSRIKESMLKFVATALGADFQELISQEPPHGNLERDVSGSWVGQECQAEGLPVKRACLPVELELTLDCGNSLRGQYMVKLGKSRFTFKVRGELCFGRFVSFDYRSTDTAAICFGSFILELNGLGDEMLGHGVGYSAFGEQITTATVNLRRKKRSS